MRVSKEDADLFIKLYHPLLYYVNTKYPVANMKTPEDIGEIPLEETVILRDKLYSHPGVIQEFIEENPFGFSRDELSIMREWNHFVKRNFVMFRSLKNYTIFLDVEDEPPKAYGVLALNDSFEDVVGPLPVMVKAVLLPFKGKIIYDGLLNFFSLLFGGNIRKDFNDTYQKAKFTFGIIESLPFSKGEKKSDEETLKFYLRSERSRDQYWEEIQKLIKDPQLLILYHQEMGKSFARQVKNQLRQAGISKGWFALFEELVVASGMTKDEAERVAHCIVPEEMWEFVYYFRLK